MDEPLLLICSFFVGYYIQKYIKSSENNFLFQKMEAAKLEYEKKLAEIKEEYPKLIAKKTSELEQTYNEKLAQLEEEKINYQNKIQNLGIEYDDMCRTLQQTFSKKAMELQAKLAESDNDRKQEFILSHAKEERDLIKKKMAVFAALKHKEYELRAQKESFLKTVKEAEDKNAKQRSELEEKQTALNAEQTSLTQQKELLNKKIKDIPALSTMYADIAQAKEDAIIYYLTHKRPAAYTAAEIVKNLKREIKNIRVQNKNLEYKLLTYESLFPVLKDYEDEPLSGSSDMPEYDDNKEDRIRYWLKPDELRIADENDRNQKALDRWWGRSKTNAEIGRDYEKSIGFWCYEHSGWRVSYYGIAQGLEDLGRDLICFNPKSKVTHIVQCKCWSAKKQIHENHINQLFGTTVRYYLENNDNHSIDGFVQALNEKRIVPVFYTSTNLSPTAKDFAESLGIEVYENVPLVMYPLIKCNISQRNGEKIYHLPFDQQYDNIKIDPPGEFFALTVAEARAAGFRRAFRWHGN